MPTNLVAVAVILLFLAPGFVYYSARSNAERKAHQRRAGLAAPPSWTSDPLRQIVDSIVASTFFSGLAIGCLLIIRWFVSLFVADSSLPSPGAWISQGWDYVPEHWPWVVSVAAAELAISLTLARLAGNLQGKLDAFTDELVEEPDTARSRATVKLVSGTIYSGFVPGHPKASSVLGPELVLFAPIDIRTAKVIRRLNTDSITLATSEIASLAIAQGTPLRSGSRLYLYSEQVSPPWG
jgi:hypothetical protein